MTYKNEGVYRRKVNPILLPCLNPSSVAIFCPPCQEKTDLFCVTQLLSLSSVFGVFAKATAKSGTVHLLR